MSIVSGVFTLPVGHALQLGVAAFVGSGLEPEDCIPSDSPLEQAIGPFIENCGVRKDIKLVEVHNIHFCCAIGSNMFKNIDAIICLTPGFYEADKDACIFVIKHEISHIKNNDRLTNALVPGVYQLAASIFGMCSLSFWPAVGVSYTVGLVSTYLCSQWRECSADDFAIENGSDEELKGGRRLHIAMKELAREERTTFWSQILISPDGDQRISTLHPSLTSRIDKIEKALLARNVEIDDEEETRKIEEKIKPYLSEKTREMEDFIKKYGASACNPVALFNP